MDSPVKPENDGGWSWNDGGWSWNDGGWSWNDMICDKNDPHDYAKTHFLNVIAGVLSIFIFSLNAFAEEKIMLFCGAAFKKPLEEIIGEFKKTKEIEVNAVYGGIGTLYSQILLGKQGDLFVVPSPDIMERAKAKGLIIPDSIKNFLYVVPSINVQKGNPKKIRELKDLARPGLKVAIGNPETVYLGILAVEIVEKSLSPEEKNAFRKNIVTYGESCEKLTTLLVLRQVDAIIGFTYLEGWYPDKVETVKLKADEIQRIGSGQAGIISYTKNRELARRFIDFLLSDDGQKIFKKYHYFGFLDEAFTFVGERKPIGGEYVVPQEWIKNK